MIASVMVMRVKRTQDNPEDMSTIDSCEYIWEAGVGFTHSPSSTAAYDRNRCEILKLLLTCFSETMYMPPIGECSLISQCVYAFSVSRLS